MQIKEVKSEGLKREYNVTIPALDLSAVMDSKLKAVGARAKIPGFRPGHVPPAILKQRYGDSVMGEVIEQSVQQAMQKAIREKDVKPALQPHVEITDYKEGGDLAFKMVVEVMPDVPAINFDKITLERFVFDVPDSEVEEALKRFAERNKKLVTKEGKAESGDVVRIDFTGRKDGVPFEGGAAKSFRLELGSGQFIPGFEDQLVGSKAGDERVVKVSFPEQYHKEDLAGVPVEFDVTVHEVLKSEVPDADEEFAKGLGFDDLEKLRAAVREQIGKDYNNIARTKLKKQLFDHLEEKVDFEVPQGMVELEFNSIWKRLQDAKAAGDTSLDKPEAELKEQYQKIAERRVRLGILLAEVGKLNKLSATKEDIANAVREQAKMFPGQEQKVFEFYRKNPAQVQELQGPILEEKAVDFILSKVKLEDKKVSAEELLKADDDEGEDKPKAKKKAAAKAESGEAKPKAAKKKKEE